jgi:dTDP-4-amino-4,6-dideoxygalactose transaminase
MNFIDLQAQRARIAPEIDAAIGRVLSTCGFIMGPEVVNFEAALASFAGARHALACANGTDALLIPLRAWDIGPGDAVFVPSFTFVASAEVAPLVGASPVFVDVLPDTYNMDPESLEAAILAVKAAGELTPRAIIAVDLFGQPADYPAISEIAKRHGLKLIADQAVLTNDPALAGLVDSIRIHGKASAEDMAARRYDNDPRYLNMRVGVNSRLDALQAAILVEKLKIYPDELVRRDAIARRYSERLAPYVRQVPKVIAGGFSNWAQYTIEHDARDALCAHLKTKGVPTAIYYPIPIHMQDVYSRYPRAPGGLPVTEAVRSRVVSLPMHPYLSEQDQDRVVEAIASFR